MTDILGNIEDEIVALIQEGITEAEKLFGFATPVVVTPTPVVLANTTVSAETKLIRNTWPTQAQAMSFYGNPSHSAWIKANLVSVPCPWTLHMDKDVLHAIQIHRKAAESLHRVLQYIWEKAGKTQEAIEKLHYDRYSGSYNYRPIRGGSGLSMHSFGVAIDFDDQENQQHAEHHLFQPDSLIVKAFEGEGWIWGGRWSPASVDAMHFQAARVR